MPEVNPFVFVLLVFIVMLIARAVVIVSENHRGAVVRLGRYMKTLAPGLRFRIPFIDLVTRVDLDANLPGWRGLSERELEAAVESLVMLGTPAGPGSLGKRPASPAKADGDGAEARALASWLVKTAGDQIGIDLSNDQMARQRIAERASGVLDDLRSSDTAQISLPFLAADSSGPKHFSLTVTRAELGQILGSGRD